MRAPAFLAAVACASPYLLPSATGFSLSHLHRRVVRVPRVSPLFAEPPQSLADAAAVVASASTLLRGRTVVVKYGGNAMTSPELFDLFCGDVATLQNLGIRVVVVHGGGPQISNMLGRTGIESKFEGGLRVSSPDVVEIAEMVLSGSVNKSIVAGICAKGGRAIGLSGKDDSLLRCTKRPGLPDLGFVGEVETVNTGLLDGLLDMGVAPVVAPIGVGTDPGPDGRPVTYNVNADTAAGRIAGELRAARVLFLTDIAGVCDGNMDLIPALSVAEVRGLIDDGTITGGMIPKVSYAVDAVKMGVDGGAFITDGRVPHALLNEVIGGGGTGLGSGAGGTVITL